MLNIVITGANGFIGKQLSYYLVEREYNVDCIDKEFDFDFVEYMGKENCYTPDKFDFEKEYDTVIHLAATSSIPAFNENPIESYTNSLQALDDAMKIKTGNFIFASSAAIHARNPSQYGRMKQICETILRTRGLNSLHIMRFYNVAGCITESNFREDHDPETHLIPNIVKENSIEIFGDGSQIRDYIHVEDLVRYIHKHLGAVSEFKISEVGTGVGHNVLDIVRVYSETMNKSVKIKFVGHRTGDVDELVASPGITFRKNINDIIRDTAESFDA